MISRERGSPPVERVRVPDEVRPRAHIERPFAQFRGERSAPDLLLAAVSGGAITAGCFLGFVLVRLKNHGLDIKRDR
jgi:hypothetical protein